MKITLEDLKGTQHTKKSLTKVIREKCLDCCCGQAAEVKLCPVEKCALWPYRMGNNPFRKPISEERREEMRRRAKERGLGGG